MIVLIVLQALVVVFQGLMYLRWRHLRRIAESELEGRSLRRHE